MRHIGIDPGLSGAIAVLTEEPMQTSLQIHDMPVMTVDRNGKAKRQVSANELAELLNLYAGKDCHVCCERVSAMAGQGVTSVFSFGRSFGMIEGILAALKMPVTFVAPATWTRAIGRSPGKDASRARAMELFPNYEYFFKRVKDDGRADAALIAHWGRKHG